MTDSESFAKVTRWLRWYERPGDQLVGEKKLEGITLDELQSMFAILPGNPMFDCFMVLAPHVHRLERAVGDRIDLEKFE
jgi:hypothetical protein